MIIELELWHFITLGLTLFGAFAAMGKALLAQTQRHLDERFSTQEETRKLNHQLIQDRLEKIEASARAEVFQWQRVEREILQLKADLPLNYVRREDYIQAMATIMAKLDAVSLRFENILLSRGGNAHE